MGRRGAGTERDRDQEGRGQRPGERGGQKPRESSKGDEGGRAEEQAPGEESHRHR